MKTSLLYFYNRHLDIKSINIDDVSIPLWKMMAQQCTKLETIEMPITANTDIQNICKIFAENENFKNLVLSLNYDDIEEIEVEMRDIALTHSFRLFKARRNSNGTYSFRKYTHEIDGS